MAAQSARLLVYFLTAAWLAVENEHFALASTTLSLRLIHRFSDEAAKAFKFSPSETNGSAGVSSWRKNSKDYYRVLLSNDFHRQKMKLGAHYQLLFPSQGSNTVSFGNDFGWFAFVFPFLSIRYLVSKIYDFFVRFVRLHYAWIDIGTPNVSFLVALDTGSDLLWVPCDCIQCAPLTGAYYSSRVRFTLINNFGSLCAFASFNIYTLGLKCVGKIFELEEISMKLISIENFDNSIVTMGERGFEP